MSGEPDLTDGERILLLALSEPFVFTPDGLLAPIPATRIAELWRAAMATTPARERQHT